MDPKRLLDYLKMESMVIPEQAINTSIMYMHCEIADGYLTLTGTDMDSYLIERISGVSGKGSFYVDVREIIKLFNGFSKGDIRFEYKDSKFFVGSGDKKEVAVIPVKEFPDIQVPSDGIKLKLNRDKLYSMLIRVAFCASTDEDMPNLNGVYFEIEDGCMKLVAGDGFRMALAEDKIDVKTNVNFLLSLKAVNVLMKILSSIEDEDITFRLINKQVILENKDILFTMKVVNAEFLNYKRMIPDEFKSKITVDRKRFLNEIVKRKRELRVKIRADEEFFSKSDKRVFLSLESEIKASLVKKRDILSVLILGITKEKFTIDVNLIGYNFHDVKDFPAEFVGESLDVMFNLNFMFDTLYHMDSEDVELCFAGTEKACLIRPVVWKDYFYFDIMMPIRM